MKVIAGLGNPGKDYQRTRHNVGFMVIDKLIEKLSASPFKIKHQALIAEASIKGEKVLLVKPQTYMNNSGDSLREILNFYKIPPEDLIVIYDDIDIGFSTIRIRKKGSAGSHNGMKSIIYQIQADTFPRIRIGVGEKHQGQDLANFVLSNFSSEEFKEIDSAVDYAALAAIAIVEDGLDRAMNKYNIKK
ncbi:aminoacyl-tRNA hydrolase [Neofamilia massiliensis]|uniref:aminoacyl-tRNA hydrolase n=1 Tax=Neofamilia massiliensis TaxID=1673724 RepID=UPI0006BB6883|nr:aminoacyl-tRNA hydrolase [Neofamilia massiliensis]